MSVSLMHRCIIDTLKILNSSYFQSCLSPCAVLADCFAWLVRSLSVPSISVVFLMWVKAARLSRSRWIEPAVCCSEKHPSACCCAGSVPSSVAEHRLLRWHPCHPLACQSNKVKLWERFNLSDFLRNGEIIYPEWKTPWSGSLCVYFKVVLEVKKSP